MEEALWCNQYATLKTESIQNHTKSHRSPVSWSTGDSKMSPVTDIWYHRKFCCTQFYLFFITLFVIVCQLAQSFYQQEVMNWQPAYSKQFQHISQGGFTQYVIFDSNTLNETELDDGAVILSFLSLFVHNFKLFWKWRIIYNKRKITIKGEKWKFTFCSLLNCYQSHLGPVLACSIS